MKYLLKTFTTDENHYLVKRISREFASTLWDGKQIHIKKEIHSSLFIHISHSDLEENISVFIICRDNGQLICEEDEKILKSIGWKIEKA